MRWPAALKRTASGRVSSTIGRNRSWITSPRVVAHQIGARYSIGGSETRLLQRDAQIFRLRRHGESVTQADHAVLEQREERLVERLHAVVLPFRQDALECALAVGVDDAVVHLGRVDQQLDGGNATLAVRAF